MHRALLVLLLVCACGRRGDENLGLSAGADKTAPELSKLTQPEELARALALGGHALDERLGPHRMDATSTLKLDSSGRDPQSLDERFSVQSDGRGAVHLVHDNSRGNGFEATALGADLYVKPRYGRFVRRKIESDELERLRATAESAAAADLRLLSRFVQVREAGTASIAGHAGVKLSLSARSTPDAAPAESEPGRKWRETLAVRYIDGDVVVDAKTGAPLTVRLDAAYTFLRDGKPMSATLAYKQTTSATPGAIAAPSDYATLERPRPMLDRQTLLEGLK